MQQSFNNDIDILREIQTAMEGNARVYTWVTETIDELEQMDKELAELRDFSVDQFNPLAIMPDVEFWERVYELVEQTGDEQLIEQCEVMMESAQLDADFEGLFDTGLISLTDEEGTTTWTVTDTSGKCSPPCDDCGCLN